jgi:hypothetical protein
MPVLGVLTTYRDLDADMTTPNLSTVDIRADDGGIRVTAHG